MAWCDVVEPRTLRECRIALGQSQAAFAAMLGVPMGGAEALSIAGVLATNHRAPPASAGATGSGHAPLVVPPSQEAGPHQKVEQGQERADPATQAVPEQEHGMIYLAQRRPERQPRLHTRYERAHSCRVDAQRRPERQPRLHAICERPFARSIPLNEGRSVNPGYTRTATAIVRVVARSTKAGASTPATRPCLALSRRLRVALRSTKAGASTPATRHRRCPSCERA